ncbi:sigma-70 family RNA polymerase sigma factor [Erythrobacteraceae bacterium CFH 75059]|uniref:sigma-70 family RNA polymerase sigma factor n=1 Tax=Qipengyuania thermophila TaxID=2509361 RepID=UPI00101F80F5|nr:sigma-70 family RNA polymerase sigma factor [Qipengyuania thermophila]TCD06296.1 sigma-70 family RNA polymerase sigma factor [Erythrobacteraceae bacterium CFH 75059]
MIHTQTQFDEALASAAAQKVEGRIRQFSPLVHRAAHDIARLTGGAVEREELVQTGFLALTECATRHAGPSEDGFAAYARTRVRGAMLDLARKTVPGSRNSAARRGAHGHANTHGEGGGSAAPRTRLVAFAPLAEMDHDRDLAFADNRPDPFAQLADQQNRTVLAAAIAALPPRLQLVLQLYYLEELSLAEVAAVLLVSVPRVHQLKARALAMVRERLCARVDGPIDQAPAKAL